MGEDIANRTLKTMKSRENLERMLKFKRAGERSQSEISLKRTGDWGFLNGVLQHIKMYANMRTEISFWRSLVTDGP